MLQSPCFDAKSRIDCPNRSGTCHTTCEKWAEFEKVKQAEYATREKTRERLSAIYNYKRQISRRVETYERNHKSV